MSRLKALSAYYLIHLCLLPILVPLVTTSFTFFFYLPVVTVVIWYDNVYIGKEQYKLIKNTQKQQKCRVCNKRDLNDSISPFAYCPFCFHMFVLQVLAAVLPVSGTSQEARW